MNNFQISSESFLNSRKQDDIVSQVISSKPSCLELNIYREIHLIGAPSRVLNLGLKFEPNFVKDLDI